MDTRDASASKKMNIFNSDFWQFWFQIRNMVILMMMVGLRVPVRWTFLHPAFSNPRLLIADHEADDDGGHSKGNDDGDG